MSAFAPIRGEKPTVEWLPCDALDIDHGYQRMIEGRKSQALILNIAENWDWQLCGPLVISRREGEDGLYIIDGQHRHAAADLRGDVPELPCIVYDFESIEHEALCFVKINGQRQPISKIDQYHARVAAKEPLALRIKETVEQYGLKVTRYADAEFWKAKEMAFPDVFGRKLERNQGAAARALKCLGEAWPDTPLVLGKYIFDGLFHVLTLADKPPPADQMVAMLRENRQARWRALAEKIRTDREIPADEAFAYVFAGANNIALSKEKGRGQRRFETVEPKGNGVDLDVNHDAVSEGRSLFPKSVQDAGPDTRVLKSGHNSRKIGKVVEKGAWAGFPIFTLTLEERSTCPDDCKMLSACYGNNMPFADRFRPGKKLENQLWEELRDLDDKNPDGFVVRLHVLGDFYSIEYVKFWQQALDAFAGLRVYGYTAHDPDGEIGGELFGLAVEQWERFSIRFSGQDDLSEMAAIVIDPPDKICPDNATICPAQKFQTACCATCALCWESERNIAFLKH